MVSAEQVQHRIEVLVRRCRSGVDLLLPAGQAAPGSVAGRTWWVAEHGERAGLQVRILLANAAVEDPTVRAFLTWAAPTSTQVRAVSSVPVPMLVCDGAVALLPVDPHDPGSEAMVTRQSATLHALGDLFSTLWSAATVLSSPAGSAADPGDSSVAADPGGTGDNPRPAAAQGGPRAALITLLAAGAKDEAIARSLGVSVRTLQRSLTELHAELGAATRFQAGVLAARAGLL